MLSGGGGTTPDLRLHDRVANRRCPPVRCSVLLAYTAALFQPIIIFVQVGIYCTPSRHEAMERSTLWLTPKEVSHETTPMGRHYQCRDRA
jgi:hypothetical protein